MAIKLIEKLYIDNKTLDFIDNEIKIILLANPNCLETYLCKGYYHSKDEVDSQRQSNESLVKEIDDLYELIQIPKPRHFTSMAAVASFNCPLEILKAYGRMVLIANLNSISQDTYIFNGDFKNLSKIITAYGSDEKRNEIFCEKYSHELYEKMKKLFDSRNTQNGITSPRLRGNYFEARLLRALTPYDISEIVYCADDSHSKIVANKIKASIKE